MFKKSLGQFFTPEFISRFMINIIDKKILNKEGIRILEPSFGEGIFINGLINHFKDSTNNNVKINIEGIEIDKNLYSKFKGKIKNDPNANIKLSLHNNDLFYLTKKYKDNNKKFDIIIGNPPYIKNNKINIDIINNIKKYYSHKGSWNLYYYFIKESINLLQEGGLLIFITPISFLTNTYAKDLRNFLFENGKFRGIYSLEEKKIFKNADIETIIFIYQKNQNSTNNIKNNKIKLGIIKDDYNVKNQHIGLDNFNIIDINHFLKNDNKWSIHDKFIKEKIENKNINEKRKKISNIFNISVGLVSGYDKAFKAENILNLDKLNNIEKKYIIDIVKANNLYMKNFRPEKYIFIPKGKYQTEEQFKTECPYIYNHLAKFKDKLIKRYGNKSLKGWEWATIRNKTIFENSKEYFFIPSITRKEVGFKYIENNNILYGGGNIITLTFKKGLSKKEKNKYKEIITSNDFTEKINKLVPKKGGRKLFTQSFIANLTI